MPPTGEAYKALLRERNSMRVRVKQLETELRQEKKRKRRRPKGEDCPPSAYRQAWKEQYPVEVEHAKSVYATAPNSSAAMTLLPYSQRYPHNMTTAPRSKAGYVLTAEDRRVFMANVAARAKAHCAPNGETPATDDNESEEVRQPSSPTGAAEIFEHAA